MIISIADIWINAQHQHITFLTNAMKENLNSLDGSHVRRLVANFIKKNKSAILSNTPQPLRDAIKNFEENFPGAILKGIAIEILKEIFDYEKFCKKKKT